MSTYYCRTAQHGQAQPHGTWQWRAKSYTSFATTESHGSTRREHRNTRDRLAFTNHFVSNQSQAIILYWMHNCTKRQQSCMPGLAALQRANSRALHWRRYSVSVHGWAWARRMHRIRIGVTSIHASISTGSPGPSLALASSSCAALKTARFTSSADPEETPARSFSYGGRRVQARGVARASTTNWIRPSRGGAMEVTAPVGWETWHVQPPRHGGTSIIWMPISEESAGSPRGSGAGAPTADGASCRVKEPWGPGGRSRSRPRPGT